VLEHHCNMTDSTLAPTPPEKAILDSGYTSHLITSSTQCIDKVPTKHGLRIGIPNGQTMQASHNATLDLWHFPITLDCMPDKHWSNPTYKNHSYLLASCAITAATTSS
jgi:hypothetical protein